MKLLAPAVLTFGLSYILYRKEGTWDPVDLWPKKMYDVWAEMKMRLDPNVQYTEEALDMLRQRGWADKHRGFGAPTFEESGAGQTQENPITFSGSPSR